MVSKTVKMVVKKTCFQQTIKEEEKVLMQRPKLLRNRLLSFRLLRPPEMLHCQKYQQTALETNNNIALLYQSTKTLPKSNFSCFSDAIFYCEFQVQRHSDFPSFTAEINSRLTHD